MTDNKNYQDHEDVELADIFDEFEKEKLLEESRPEFSVARCCGNCKYFKYFMGNQRRGLCLVEVHLAGKTIKGEIPNTRQGFKDARDSAKYPKTHVTCVCDNHALTGSAAIINVGEYCGEKLDLKGDD
jgi:hypothetical protein